MLPWRTLHSYPDSFNNNIKNVPRDSLTSGQSTDDQMRNHIILKIPIHEI